MIFFLSDNRFTVDPSHKPKILICIPAFNEAKTIADIIVKSKHHGDEVIVYDDGSTDNTYQVAICGSNRYSKSRE